MIPETLKRLSHIEVQHQSAVGTAGSVRVNVPVFQAGERALSGDHCPHALCSVAPVQGPGPLITFQTLSSEGS